MGKRQKPGNKQKIPLSKSRKEIKASYKVEETNDFDDDEVEDEGLLDDEVKGLDVGDRRDDDDLENMADISDVEEEQLFVEDPYLKWFGKRTFDDNDKKKSDDILKTYSLMPVDLGESLQSKASENGLDNISELIHISGFPLKAKLRSSCENDLNLIENNKKINTLFQHMLRYHDILYASGEDISANSDHNLLILKALSIHIMNHVIKSCDIERAHTASIKEKKRLLNEQTHERIMKKEAEKSHKPYQPNPDVDINKEIVIPEYKDQGFTRPKVLILCPYRYYALQFVENILQVLPARMNVNGKSKLYEEFQEPPDEDSSKKTKDPRWKQYFPDTDCFRLGIALNGKNVRLYSYFYNSDIVIASPLSLKQIENTQGFDYLSSIEMVIVYGMDMIAMQNFDHLKGIQDNMNMTIAKDRNTDYSRLRDYYLNDFQKYMRQTIFIGNIISSNMLGLFRRGSFNPIGRIEIRPFYEGSVSDIITPPRQLFLRLPCQIPTEVSTIKLKYLENNVIKVLNNEAYKKILIYCDNYFEYIYVKRLLMENCDEKDCAIIDEYQQETNNIRNRSYFYNDTVRVLLFSGRYEYFKRMNIRGINSIYFVSIPSYPQFYSEFVNNMATSRESSSELSVGVTVLYTKFDTYPLERVVGTSRYKKMITGKRDMYLFC